MRHYLRKMGKMNFGGFEITFWYRKSFRVAFLKELLVKEVFRIIPKSKLLVDVIIYQGLYD
ncbi:MAG: hypothetical protein K2I71_00480 [Helicobacter sp.]|nr:hypothetical protein [Helicobacter sp.]